MEMEKSYNPQAFEKRIYKNWEEKGYFIPQADKKKKPFTIVIPPPNITGQLHMGHALNNSIQDSIIRYKRMKGFSTLWLPGTDHASIATEVKIVEQMKKEGLTKASLGREGFLDRAFKWKDQYGGRIIEQLKCLGSSCDWSRLAFTMDDRCSKAVKHVFVELYKKGLIYQGDRIINWCPSCKTAISDAEVEFAESQGNFWHIRYPFADGSGEIIVATTRPETMLGDTAVAVNPNDKKYASVIGKMLVLPLVNKQIPVVADEYVDMEFGTGAVKITPAHDPNDFEVGLRHNLEVVRVMDDAGYINEFGGKYKGLERYEARKKIVNDLKEGGYLVKIEPHTHNVGHCYRCNTVIEPIVSKQWFVKMEPLAKPAIDCVKGGDIKFIPKRFEKIYFNWMENIKDWCISRQLWWGHRIPAYYCDDCDETVVATEKPEKCPKCGSTHLRQDEDVLDTWFSSALWPFSTLGFPEKTEDLEYFYPTSVLVTAYDIIFFWVARMIFSGLEHMKEIPFKDVLITGLVRDELGRKMSKSLGNGIDPLVIIDKYGADTLRFCLLNGIAPGGDTRFSERKVEGCRNFMNKIWNASRFVMMNIEGKKLKDISKCELTTADKWILARLNNVTKAATKNMDKYEFGLASEKLYDFMWSDLCDWYIELTKPVLYGDDENKRIDTLSVLTYVLRSTIKLLHPFIPFITEEIYQNLPHKYESVMIADYPKYSKKFDFEKDERNFGMIMEIIQKIRNIRAEMNVNYSKRTNLLVVSGENDELIKENDIYLKKLAFINEIEFISSDEKNSDSASITSNLCEAYIPLGELVDREKELARLNTELSKIMVDLNKAQSMLANEGFVRKAPEAVIKGEREKVEKFTALKEQIEEKIAKLG